MNRERLTVLRDHLAMLDDSRFDMRVIAGVDGEWDMSRPVPVVLKDCGTAACIAGWANALFAPRKKEADAATASDRLDLTGTQMDRLFMPDGFHEKGRHTRADAIAAIQSMLDSPDDDAMPVWPDSNITGAGK